MSKTAEKIFTLRDYRKEAGLTQLELGNVLGVDFTTISKYESRDVCPSMSIFKKISDMTGGRVTMETFLK